MKYIKGKSDKEIVTEISAHIKMKFLLLCLVIAFVGMSDAASLQKRVTCDLLSLQIMGNSFGDSACAAHCIGLHHSGGHCSGGVCVCR
ncbi:defensin coprisin-like [Haliotis rufescens]|uniref:defensin coprisin-like n=1 Tax=Haliotis rufescens TaxID=6454 RepID=UPI001EAFB97E|nr:defensin coprisin-like [Haliotis rufescens]